VQIVSADGRFQRYSTPRAINAFFDLADAIIGVRSLIRQGWTMYRGSPGLRAAYDRYIDLRDLSTECGPVPVRLEQASDTQQAPSTGRTNTAERHPGPLRDRRVVGSASLRNFLQDQLPAKR
jgi:hypothetical protein